MTNLSEIQWLALELLMRAKQKGAPVVSRKELLYSANVPDEIKVKLTWAMLKMPDELVIHRGTDFEISAKGELLFNAMFNKPSTVADVIIALPDRSGEALQ